MHNKPIASRRPRGPAASGAQVYPGYTQAGRRPRQGGPAELRPCRAATDGWWPVWEDHLSNLICAFLREHLTTKKPVINREVEIQPSKRDGSRTDIHVQAPDPSDAALQPLTAIIEVKGCWNAQIKTGIPEQLIPYLQPRPGWAGIFLVGHFHQPGREHENYTGWPATSERKRSAGRHRISRTALSPEAPAKAGI
jgi:hypothetical protein